jgi:hypothetical protein
MKLKEGFVLRQVAGSWIVLPVGVASVDFNGMVSLNETGALLWQALEKGADTDALVDALTAEYEVERAEAAEGVEEFLVTLRSVGCLEE